MSYHKSLYGNLWLFAKSKDHFYCWKIQEKNVSTWREKCISLFTTTKHGVSHYHERRQCRTMHSTTRKKSIDCVYTLRNANGFSAIFLLIFVAFDVSNCDAVENKKKIKSCHWPFYSTLRAYWIWIYTAVAAARPIIPIIADIPILYSILIGLLACNWLYVHMGELQYMNIAFNANFIVPYWAQTLCKQLYLHWRMEWNVWLKMHRRAQAICVCVCVRYFWFRFPPGIFYSSSHSHRFYDNTKRSFCCCCNEIHLLKRTLFPKNSLFVWRHTTIYHQPPLYCCELYWIAWTLTEIWKKKKHKNWLYQRVYLLFKLTSIPHNLAVIFIFIIWHGKGF